MSSIIIDILSNLGENIKKVYKKLCERSSWQNKISRNGKTTTLFGISEVTMKKRKSKLSKLPNEEVQIIIPHHESFDTLNSCIESIIENTTSSYSILVCDNNSSKRTRESLNKLCESFDFVDCIKADKKKGLAYATNVGLKKAFQKRQNIAILDSNIIVTPNWLEELKIVLYNDSNVGMAVPRQVILDNNVAKLHVPSFQSDLEVDIGLSSYYDNVIDPLYSTDGECELIFAPLTCALLRYEDAVSVGFLDAQKKCDIYCWNYSNTLRYNIGKKIVYTPYSKIYTF